MIHTARSRMIIITTFVVTILAAVIAIGLGSVHISIPNILSTLINGRGQEGYIQQLYGISAFPACY